MALASVVDPTTAIVFTIVPILAVNLSLARELSTSDLGSCGGRFGPLVASALVGTVALDSVPTAPLRVGLGVITLGFVATLQDAVTLPGVDCAKDGCFVETTPAMVGVGGVSGLVFGGTNVGVQLIAYVRSCEVSHGLFVALVATTFLGLNGVRVAVAGALGLYPELAFVAASAAAIPAVGGAFVGKHLRSRVGERGRRLTVVGLLSLVGVRLPSGESGSPSPGDE
jgi:hypothetical protein